MKKALKIVGIIILVTVCLLIILLVMISKKDYVQKNYFEKVETNGKIETKYIKLGENKVKKYEEATLQGFSKYIIYYPEVLETSNNTYPIVVFANGTGAKVSKYTALLEHLASWGFVVIGTEEEYDWNGFASEMCIRHLIKLNELHKHNNQDNIFYKKLDLDNIGITGHSQGGVGVFNAITTQLHKDIYKAAVSISPTNIELATSLEWEYDLNKINTPILLLSGAGGGDDWVVTGEQLNNIYDKISNNKVKMRRKNTSHGEMLYSADGYVTAWFMFHLQNDKEAESAFFGDEAEILNNSLYQDIHIDYETHLLD